MGLIGNVLLSRAVTIIAVQLFGKESAPFRRRRGESGGMLEGLAGQSQEGLNSSKAAATPLAAVSVEPDTGLRKWMYFASNGGYVGPFTDDEIVSAIRRGRIDSSKRFTMIGGDSATGLEIIAAHNDAGSRRG